jgi:hypothetical protein
VAIFRIADLHSSVWSGLLICHGATTFQEKMVVRLFQQLVQFLDFIFKLYRGKAIPHVHKLFSEVGNLLFDVAILHDDRMHQPGQLLEVVQAACRSGSFPARPS